MDTFIHYGIAAAAQAIADAGLPTGDALDEEASTRIGCVIGSVLGPAAHRKLPCRVPQPRCTPDFALFVPATIINMTAGHVSMRYGFKGPNISIVTACTTGLHCIGDAGRMIEYGDADVNDRRGSEATVSIGYWWFRAMRALSTRNDDP